MYQILVATDFSPIADNAIEYAAELAKHYKARIVLFHSFALPVHIANTILPSMTVQELFDANEAILKQKAESIRSAYGIDVVFETRYSFIEEELNTLIADYKIDLVVLGMTGRTIEHDLFGNVTATAISKMKFPVLAVPAGAKFNGMKKVLFACDVLNGIPMKILSRIKDLASELNSEVEVFFVDKTIQELKAQDSDSSTQMEIINDRLNGITFSHKNVRSNSVIAAIEKEIISFEADLLIMVPKKYGFWASMIHKSKTRVMASGLNIPLLSIPV